MCGSRRCWQGRNKKLDADADIVVWSAFCSRRTWQGLMDEQGRRAPRDIVQFVAFKDAASKEQLAAQVVG